MIVRNIHMYGQNEKKSVDIEEVMSITIDFAQQSYDLILAKADKSGNHVVEHYSMKEYKGYYSSEEREI